MKVQEPELVLGRLLWLRRERSRRMVLRTNRSNSNLWRRAERSRKRRQHDQHLLQNVCGRKPSTKYVAKISSVRLAFSAASSNPTASLR